MWDFSIRRTLGIMGKTMPFILFRMVVFFGITLAYILATGAGAGVGFGIGNIFDDAEGATGFALWGGVLGFGMISIAVYWIREYILYIVKAGHIAVMVRLIDGEEIPGGQGQIAYAKTIVTERFSEASVLFGVDQVIKGIIKVITGLIGGVGMILPIPGVQGLLKFVNTIVRISLTYVDEIILGYNMRINSQNPYQTSQDGVVLYAQNAKSMIKNAIWLSVFLWIFSAIIFILMLAPAGAILYFFPGQMGGFAFVLALVFAWAFKAAILEPFAVAALMSVYFEKIEGQVPDAEWSAKLAGASNKFVELKDKASDFVMGSKSSSVT
ncbi:MAG: hypothetical protein V3V02_10560 [Rhizobiaceae bacterium]